MRERVVSDPLGYARAALARWGEWVRCDGVRMYRLGFPGASPVAHAGEGRGGIVIPAEARDELAERVDSVLARMKRGGMALQHQVVELVYRRCLTLSEAAGEMRVSEKTVKGYKASAEAFVAGDLEAWREKL